MGKCFTIGCDPEFFLREKQSGKLISAIPHIKGTKTEPQLLPQGGNIQHDNVAVEIATDPAKSMETFVQNIKLTLTEAVKILPTNTEIVAIPSANFDKKQLEHPEAEVFGCDPDYDAWEIRENEKPCSVDNTFRSCGAHIHLGTDGKDENAFLLDFEGKLTTVKIMDCVHGIISTVLDSGKKAIDRRKLYGKPGAHRPKEYGVEYRVLSNYWLKSPVTVSMMYHLSKDVLTIVREGKAEGLINAMGENQVKDTIINGDADAAMKMIETNLLPILSEDSVYYFNEVLAKIKANDMNFHMEWELYKEAVA
ncbi:MAG: hypothetical protein DRI84_09870 [Bacteroidetes bacterium]|nr:MAG: hypothetical protein DRI84_09870 [Bacteroidota bacterium]